jgi:hypothetical protein
MAKMMSVETFKKRIVCGGKTQIRACLFESLDMQEKHLLVFRTGIRRSSTGYAKTGGMDHWPGGAEGVVIVMNDGQDTLLAAGTPYVVSWLGRACGVPGRTDMDGGFVPCY